ncbi:ribonuclease P protein component [Mycobacterium sp. MAA66]|uniref:ribonuclease P protein component n=1 Tax=Mycobacterium sp. MAA66 TaxID=3156297 RepID=UPI00351256C0
MLPARNRMRRSTDFRFTVSRGVRAGQPDLVVHALAADPDSDCVDPTVGLVVGKSVGNAVARHRVSRQLRHCARNLIPDLSPGERVVIRALPGSAHAVSAELEHELRAALDRVRSGKGRR